MKTPILFIIFNRPGTTKVVFEAIRQAKPSKLFIAADGPRKNKPGEKELCEKTRKITEKIDWECEVKTLFREENLGCGKAVSGAISWFFENVEEGIILEDDCLPHPSFFRFCEELLERYRFDDKVFMISGNNFLPKSLRPKGSYYFSQLPHIWGWATWKRAWQKYDFDIKDLPDFIKNKEIEKKWVDKSIQNYWLENFKEVFYHNLDTWDYQLVYNMWKNKSISIAPNVNLVSNIGFGTSGTHTLNKNDPSANLPSEEISFPIILNNPSTLEMCDDYENRHIRHKNYRIKLILKKLGLFNTAKKLYLVMNKA
ncbi:MAG: nucleotide-diphospho-sugar transferase [Candidatus Paceibacterota bacterium]|jgi:hypothetical protein